MNAIQNIFYYLQQLYKFLLKSIHYAVMHHMHLASRNSGTDSTERTVELLINANADVNLQENLGWTALHYASCYSKTQRSERTVELLINANANVNLQDNHGLSALHHASYSGTEST